jgi:hypothetical protein
MSIFLGNLLNETINDNRFKINTYYNSNVININLDEGTKEDAIINFRNRYEIGSSNNYFSINAYRSNVLNITSNKTSLLSDLEIKNNFYTSNNSTYIQSNTIIKLTKDSNNSFTIQNSNNYGIFQATNSNIKINFNNSNKISFSSNGTDFYDNIFMNSNKSIYTTSIKTMKQNIPIQIDYASISNLDIGGVKFKKYLTIDNDEIYPYPSFTINRYNVNCNIAEFFVKDNSNVSNLAFSINQRGFVGIGYSNPHNPIDINIDNSNVDYLLKYQGISSNSSNSNIFNDNFVITSRGNIGIGTSITKNQLSLNIKDDIRNNVNYPAINFNINYDRNSNYKTSNVIDLKFIADRGSNPIYNDEDAIIDRIPFQSNNFVFSITSNSTFIPLSIEPFANAKVIVNVSNFIQNDYIFNNGISNIIPIYNSNYLPYDFTYNNIDYVVNYQLIFPNFLKFDLNEITLNGNKINPNLVVETFNTNFYRIVYNNYIIKNDTIKPYDENNLILKEVNQPIYSLNDGSFNDFTIFLNHRLYIEKNNYELNDFVDYLTYNYQKPSGILLGTSNGNFVCSLDADGKLSLGDEPPADYYLYVDKKSRLNNLECQNLSSIPNRKNIGFSGCNISNINKGFFNVLNTNHINTQTASIASIIVANSTFERMDINNLNSIRINTRDLNGCNLSLTSNLFNPALKTVLGSNNSNLITSNPSYFMAINVNSNFSNGLCVQSFNSNLSPSILLQGFSNNNFPTLSFKNLTADYSLNLNTNINKNFLSSNNLNLRDNRNNITIFKHINFDDNNNQLVFGSCNNIIFDLKPNNITTNSTNKIALGLPYRYLIQNNLNLNNWENYFKDNLLNSSGMLNVYGNINFSSTNNTSFLSCIASEFPNERIGVAIGSNNVRNGFLFNVEGNAYFSSNINIDNDIFVKGTVGNVSDIRIKKDLKKIDCPLDKIEKISGYVYERIDTGRFETGLIAQEVLKILPEVINKDKDDYYNISYGNMMGLLVEGVKELNERLKRLEEKDFRNC